MIFEPNHIYHIFNQGNNRGKIFFKRDNYFFFLKKIETHVLPYGDLLAYCLMPNHFHLMVYYRGNCQGDSIAAALEVTPTVTRAGKPRSFNDSIGIMLRSYTRAINNQEKRTGTLFREETKAECLTKPVKEPPLCYNSNGATTLWTNFSEMEYPQTCFNYIHNNPVKANLVKHPADWEFSSFRDYCGLRNEKIINKTRTLEFGITQ